MKLYFSPPSPYSRKVRIVAALLGLDDKIELIVADTANPSDAIRSKNPLGKIPTLECDDGVCVYDSPVIVDFLDDLAGGGRVLPKERAARYAALTLEALADGICDASLLQVYEVRMRAENERSASWIAHQSSKVERALGALEADPPAALTRADQADVGAVALACALGYLDLRFEGAWRAGHPRLVDWLGSFAAAVPAFGATKT